MTLEQLKLQDMKKKNNLMLILYSISLLAAISYTLINHNPLIETILYSSQLGSMVIFYIVFQVALKKSCTYFPSSLFLSFI